MYNDIMVYIIAQYIMLIIYHSAYKKRDTAVLKRDGKENSILDV